MLCIKLILRHIWHDIYCIVLDQLWLLRQFETLLRKEVK